MCFNITSVQRIFLELGALFISIIRIHCSWKGDWVVGGMERGHMILASSTEKASLKLTIALMATSVIVNITTKCDQGRTAISAHISKNICPGPSPVVASTLTASLNSSEGRTPETPNRPPSSLNPFWKSRKRAGEMGPKACN
ncbi:hypothetical protein K438DRAFT_1819488 [Mycena galopus ATCC 62051]|nr:hypothetical protein K438DRAFT_1819488 [Mycena galopus ATCC 62051]